MPLEQGQRKVIKHLQNTLRKEALIGNTNREPTTKRDWETVVTCFNVLSNQSRRRCVFSVSFSSAPPSLERAWDKLLSSHQLQRKQNHCIVYTPSCIICLQTVLHQPFSLCCPPWQPATQFEQEGVKEHKEAIRGWEQLPNVTQRDLRKHNGITHEQLSIQSTSAGSLQLLLLSRQTKPVL